VLEIRPVEEKDFPGVLALIKEFQAESLNAYNLFCDDKIALSIMYKFLGNSFVLEKGDRILGVIAGLIVTYPLSNEKIFQEHIWYVHKEYRRYGLMLYRALEDYCKQEGIKKIVMVHMANSKAEKLGKFYRRLGYELLESHYIKHIGG
jgi:GNAT superfamily N-acetyltransferase